LGSKRYFIKQKIQESLDDKRTYTPIIDTESDEDIAIFFDPVCIFPQLYWTAAKMNTMSYGHGISHNNININLIGAVQESCGRIQRGSHTNTPKIYLEASKLSMKGLHTNTPKNRF